MIFAKRLCSLMEQKDVSQKDLAEIVGRPQSAISQYCTGKQVPNMLVAEKMCRFFKISIHDLAGEEGSANPQKTGHDDLDDITKMIATCKATLTDQLSTIEKAVEHKKGI